MANGSPTVSPADRLRAELARPGVLVAPGVSDGISARLAARLGFPALYVSGAGTAAALGFPDMSLMTGSELVAAARTVTMCAPGALTVVDIDTGYGGLATLRRVVTELAAARVAAVHVEDQPFPKKCGYLEPEPCVPIEEMVWRIRAALATDGHPVVIARTDALLGQGMAETLSRVEAYQAAGAEMIMVNGISEIGELAEIATVCRLPMLHNVSGSDRTPDVPAGQADELGVKIVIYPIQVARAAAAGAEAMLTAIRDRADRSRVPNVGFAEFFALAGWDDATAFEDAARAGGLR